MNSKARQGVESVSSSINAMLSVLNGVTPLSLDRTSSGVSLTLNPFEFIMSILQKVVGYDRIVEFLTEISVYGLPVMEDSLKISLITSLKDLFSCSINPVIGEKLIKEGVVLDLSTIDLLKILNRCPLGDENEKYKLNGSFFYFDVDRFTIPEELEYSKDLNAVIWYVKHRAKDRTVWYGCEHQDEEHETLSKQTANSPGTQPSENDGVITMEYSETAEELKNSIGGDMQVQVPHGNCLHVFLGNAKGITNEQMPSHDEIAAKTTEFRNLLEKLRTLLSSLETQYENETDITEKGIIQCNIDVVSNMINAINDGVSICDIIPNAQIDNRNGMLYVVVGDERVYMSDYVYNHNRNDLSNEILEYNLEVASIMNTYQYRTPQENYYYQKTLFEFNTDYVMSVKFFDPKVLAAQIVDILTGCFTLNLNLSFEERLIRNEVEKMLQKIVENDETTVVNDCFFSFTNDEYNMLVDETEKERIGKYTGDTYAYGSSVDYERIYEELNKVASCATLSEQVSVFTRTINEISKEIKPDIYKETDEFALNFSFLNNLLRSLTLSVVYGVISPKIYLLMAINLKILGREANFDLTAFIEYFKTLLIDLVKNITDSIMSQMTEWLISLVKDLVQRLADRLLLEQSRYYIQLLMSCMRSFRLMWGNEDWNMADVEYADIVSTGTGERTVIEGSMSNPINTKC